MKKILLILTIVSHFVFGQNASSKYDAVGKKSHLQTGVTPKANVITYTDTSASKSPVWWFNTGRVKFKNSIVAIDTTDFDGILVRKGDSLLLADKNLIVIGATNGLTLSSGFAKIGGTLTDSTVINLNNRSFVLKTNSADVNKEVIKITDESDNIALIVNQSGNNVIALGKNAGSGIISAEDCNFLGENAGRGATNALFSNFIGKNAGLNATTATQSNFFGQGAGSSAPSAGGSNFLGPNAGAGASDAGNSNFLGQSAGNNAVNANGSNFLGYESGNGASNANGSNFLGNFSGSNSTNANNSNFFGFVSGRNATNAHFSNFFGPGSGDAAINANNSNFFGAYTGLNSTNASNSNFFGKYAGRNAINAANSIFIGTETGDSSVNLANSIVIGKYSGRKETLNTTTGGTSIQIGNYTHTGGFNNTIAIGDSATNTKTNQVVFAPKYRHLRLRGVDYELPSSQGGVDTYLKNNGSGVLSWATASGGSGTVTSVTSANTDISVANTTTTPVLTLNSGSGANQIVKRDGSGNIAGYTPTTLPSGQINIGDGTNTAFPRTLSGAVTVDNLGVTSYSGIVPANKITDSVSRTLPIVGNIIEGAWNLSHWTKMGSQTFTTSGSNLNLVGGSPTNPDYSNFYTNTNYSYTMYNNWEVNIPIVVGTINATSHGVCFGIDAKNSSPWEFQSCLALSTSKLGKIILVTGNGTNVVDSTLRGISVNSGDTIILKIARVYDNINTSILNISGAQENANHLIVNARDYNSTIPATIGLFAITGTGGNHTILPINVKSNHKIGSDVMIISDSRGGSVSNIENTPAMLLQQITAESVDFCYAPGAKLQDFPINEINNLKGVKNVIFAGINNIFSLEDTSTVANRMQTLLGGINGLQGVNKFYIDELPVSTIDVSPYSYAIKRRVGSSGCIYAFNSFLSPSGVGVDSTVYIHDKIHLNNQGTYRLSNIIRSSLNLKKSNSPKPNTSKPYFINTRIISTNGTCRPRWQLETIDIHGGSQFHINNKSTDGVGGFAVSNSDNQFHIQGGYYKNLKNKDIATSIIGSGIDIDSGVVKFNTFDGAVKGSQVSVSQRAVLDNNGNFGIGTSLPITKLHINQLNEPSYREEFARYTLSGINNDFLSINNGTSSDVGMGGGLSSIRNSSNGTALYLTGFTSSSNDNGGNSLVNITGAVTSNITNPFNGTYSQTTRKILSVFNNTNTLFDVGANGNIGIGTASSQSKLDIEGSLAVGTTYSGTTAAPANGAIIEGIVGIGTATPATFSLDVRSSHFSVIRAYSSETPSSISGASISLQSPFPTASSQRLAVVSFGAFNGTNDVIGASIEASSTQAYTLSSAYGTDLLFRTTATGTASRVTNMILNSEGSLGIGTTTPVAKLEVNGLVKYKIYVVSGLPTCNSGIQDQYATVTDATTPTYLGTLTGGGSVRCPVFCNGTAWVSH